MNTRASYEYINDYLYFVVRPEKEGSSSFIYCSGANLYKFLPITKGRHRPMSNPVRRGLQLVNLGVRALALLKGATPVPLTGNCCADIVPAGDGWYKDQLLIENAPESFPEEVVTYCVVELMKKIDRAILLHAEMPAHLLPAAELQLFIDNLCRKYGGGG